MHTKGPNKVIKIMVVDDHHEFRSVIRSILVANPGLTVVAEAVDGREALEKNLLYQPDIIVMDVQMPNMTGIEATRRITAERRAVDVIMSSMCADRETISAAFKVGAKGYLRKDCLYEDLVPAIYAIKCHQNHVSACFWRNISAG